jgi:3-oxoacyl-[acyl-carrier protein] reductase
MLLEDKNAVIYGAGGSIGRAVARAFAREGAKVYLAGRTLESLEEVAHEIRSAGGVTETAKGSHPCQQVRHLLLGHP